MASAQCEHCGKNLSAYPYPHDPVPHPQPTRRIICEAPNCTRVALIWLSVAEELEYRQGVRSFSVFGHRPVRVK
jgi:hypothetical protein